MVNAIILGCSSAATTCFIYYISGKPYVHEDKIHLGEEKQLLESFGRWFASVFGMPCLVCINTWVSFAIACLSLTVGASTLFEAILSPVFAFIALKLFQKLGLD